WCSPDQVFDVAAKCTVELYKERDTAHLLARNRSQVTLEERGQGLLSKVRREFHLLPRFVFERIILGVGLQEKIERVNNRHLGDEVDFDAKFPRRLWENQARKVIRLRILLPVDKMLGRFNPQRIAQNPAAAVRRGSQ